MPSRFTSSRSSKRVSSRSLASRLLSGSSSSRTLGSLDHRPRQGEALLLPAAQKRRRAIGQAVELDERQGLLDLVAYLLAARTCVSSRAAGRPRSRTHSYAARSRRTETPCRCRARRAARPCASWRRIDHIVADENFVLASRRLQSRDRAQRRGFAAAARAEQREKLPLLDIEVDAAHRVHLAALGLVIHVQILNSIIPRTATGPSGAGNRYSGPPR